MAQLNVKLQKEANLKVCKKCKEIKHFTDFRKHTNGKYHISSCRKCENIRNRNYYKKNKEKLLEDCRKKNTDPTTFETRRNKTLLSRYNITLEDYNKLAEEQNNCCKICGNGSTELVVDHCHSSKKVRGLLCQPCNKGLGMFRDNKNNLQKAIEYLNND